METKARNLGTFVRIWRLRQQFILLYTDWSHLLCQGTSILTAKRDKAINVLDHFLIVSSVRFIPPGSPSTLRLHASLHVISTFLISLGTRVRKEHCGGFIVLIGHGIIMRLIIEFVGLCRCVPRKTLSDGSICNCPREHTDSDHVAKIMLWRYNENANLRLELKSVKRPCEMLIFCDNNEMYASSIKPLPSVLAPLHKKDPPHRLYPSLTRVHQYHASGLSPSPFAGLLDLLLNHTSEWGDNSFLGVPKSCLRVWILSDHLAHLFGT